MEVRHLRILTAILIAALVLMGAISAVGLAVAERVAIETIDKRGLLWSHNQDLRKHELGAELAHHRFMLTGDEAELAPYQTAKDEIPKLVDEAEDLAFGSDRETIEEELRRQSTLFERWTSNFGDPSIEARSEDEERARALAESPESQELLAEIETANGQVAAIVGTALESGTEDVERVVDRSLIVVAAVVVLTVVAVYLAYRRLRGHAKATSGEEAETPRAEGDQAPRQ